MPHEDTWSPTGAEGPEPEARIAPRAEIDHDVVVGPGASVWDGACIRSGARIGARTTVARGVYVDHGVVVGDGCKIQDNALLYRPAVLGDGVFVGPGAIVTNDRVPRAVAPDGAPKGAQDWAPAGVTVGEGASLGAASVVVAGTTIGPWALVGAGAVVHRDVPAYALVVGNPARRVAWVGPSGEKLVAVGSGRWRCPVSGSEFHEDDGRLTLSGVAT